MLKTRLSAKIIPFPSESVLNKCSPKYVQAPLEEGHSAQILFFLGVRYERHEDSRYEDVSYGIGQENWLNDAVLYNQSA